MYLIGGRKKFESSGGYLLFPIEVAEAVEILPLC